MQLHLVPVVASPSHSASQPTIRSLIGPAWLPTIHHSEPHTTAPNQRQTNDIHSYASLTIAALPPLPPPPPLPSLPTACQPRCSPSAFAPRPSVLPPPSAMHLCRRVATHLVTASRSAATVGVHVALSARAATPAASVAMSAAAAAAGPSPSLSHPVRRMSFTPSRVKQSVRTLVSKTEAVEVIDSFPAIRTRLMITCEHASMRLPEPWKWPVRRQRHTHADNRATGGRTGRQAGTARAQQ